MNCIVVVTSSVIVPDVDPIEAFVIRMYQQCLSRDPDQSGLDGWVDQLENGHMNGAQIAEQFVFSTEMLNKNLSDEEFVNVLYRAMMGREADANGRAGWVNNLKNQHMNGAQIAEAFIFSDEFVGKNVSNEKYVELLYNTLLGRPSDENGKKGWVGELQNNKMTRRGMMKAFIESTEFTGICETYGITRGTVE